MSLSLFHWVQHRRVIRMISIQIVQRYDLIIIQEIRDIDGVAFPELVDLVNEASGGQYSSTISPRSGRSSSKEQNGYIYKYVVLLHAFVFLIPSCLKSLDFSS